MSDALGDRMKQYESVTKFILPKRTNTLIRIDGRAFHTYTRKMQKPFDQSLMDCMDHTANTLCEEIQNSRIAYIQSDEISILCTDFADISTTQWFGGNIQKTVSISASIATCAFNIKAHELGMSPTAQFDARAYTIPDYIEVENYFIWRQKDAEKNSIQMLARSHYSHKEMHGKKTSDLHDMLHAKGMNWNNIETSRKRGRAAVKDKGSNKWILDNEIPIFTEDRNYLRSMIPIIHKENENDNN